MTWNMATLRAASGSHAIFTSTYVLSVNPPDKQPSLGGPLWSRGTNTSAQTAHTLIKTGEGTSPDGPWRWDEGCLDQEFWDPRYPRRGQGEGSGHRRHIPRPVTPGA